jgi:hypothetical protein
VGLGVARSLSNENLNVQGQWGERPFACPAALAEGVEARRGLPPGAIWHGQKSWNGVAILARVSKPQETRRGLPGDREDAHSRYIEAAVAGVLIGRLYVPNGNPAPGPKLTTSCAGMNG